MERREFICINCPLGCALTVTMEQGQVLKVEGEYLSQREELWGKRGDKSYAHCDNQRKSSRGTAPVVSVKTASDIPKGKIKDCMAALKQVSVKAPVCIGDVILKDVCSTGTDIVATRNVAKKVSESNRK